MTSGFNYQEELSKCSTMEDITGPNGLVQRMVKDAIEQILQSEITDYITDEKVKGIPRSGMEHHLKSKDFLRQH